MSDLFTTGIRPAIDQHLIELAAEKRQYGEYWSASSAGYCHRKLIFERLEVPPVNEADPRLQRVFTAGKVFHEWIQGITKEAGLSIAQELELQDEVLMIRGHIDDLVLLPAYVEASILTPEVEAKPSNLILYDYKTQNSRAFIYTRTHGNEMSYYHKMQLATYMYMLRNGAWDKKKWRELGNVTFETLETAFAQIPNLSEARILKISKDDLMMDEQQLLWNSELEQQIIKYWTELDQAWKSKIMPPCTCDKYENGFMAKEKFNPFFYKGHSCSLEWFGKHREDKLWITHFNQEGIGVFDNSK